MNEVKPASLMPKPVVKGGLVAGGAAAVLAFLGLIPVLGFFFGFLNWIVAFVAGYVIVAATGGTKEKIADVVKNSIIAGLVISLVAGIASGVASILNGLIFSRVSIFGVYINPTIGDFVTWFIGSFIWAVIIFTFWTFLGGLVYPYFDSSKLPESLRSLLDKAKRFLLK